MSAIFLLTGANGFVGRHVHKALVERGFRIRAVVRDGKQQQLANVEGIESVVSTPDLFLEGADWWADICKDIDTIIHAAWYAEPGEYLQSQKNLGCLIGTLQLAQGAVRSKIRRFVGIGTCLEYDTKAGELSEQTPLRPETPYAGSKAAAFMALSSWLPSQEVKFAWCRLFYLYGEGEDPRRLVPYLRGQLAKGEKAALTRGEQIRDFLDVEEAARRIVDIAEGSYEGAVNICSGVHTTVRQLAEQIADEYGRRDLLQFGARPDNPMDPPCVVGIRNLNRC